MKTNLLAVVGLLTLLALAGCGVVGNRAGPPESKSFGSNGERIYFTASDASGQAIIYQGGPSESAMAGEGCPGNWPARPAMAARAMVAG